MTVPWEKGLDKSKPMNQEIMWENLIKFKEVMDKYKIPFILIFGGLLGLVRDGKLIDTDDDIDVACLSEDHKNILPVVEELLANGFYIPEKNESPLHDHFFIRNGEKIEIWWFDKLDGERIYDQVVRYPEEHFEHPETFSHLGINWLVPKNAKDFLEITYGSTWNIPQANGNYMQGLGQIGDKE